VINDACRTSDVIEANGGVEEMALRVIAGEAGGRRLVAPKGGARPTTDRAKEALFAALGPDVVVDAVVLDLFAGSGALGIEALSRGAARAVFVDRDRRAADAVRANLESTRFADRARVQVGPAASFLRRGEPAAGFDLVFLDPPYDLDAPQVGAMLADLDASGVLAPGATVVVETRRDAVPGLPEGWIVDWQRAYGDTLLTVATV
jgi:16S rRNA (guanine966-N2)-methyltransferase